MAQNSSRNLENLETSKLWKQAGKLSEAVRHFADVLPHSEQFTLANPLYQNAVQLTTDIAMALGQGGTSAAYEYRLARGRLFSIKSLVLMAQHYELAVEVKHIINDANGIQNLLDTKITELEKDKKHED
ncbi:MAG TPA: four helix bundle protein [Candidatus Saccharimonadales bacterium]|nr:four helix bundle protein [Candidatus Saccharimonadales bacterium]